jgi:toxin YoeB
MSYKIELTDEFMEDISFLRKAGEKAALKKIESLLMELEEHPYTGTGHPKQLSGDRAGQWSRHITKKHRLVYKIHDNTVTVLVLSAYGHYDDK